jgi:signal transduction histidine kinase
MSADSPLLPLLGASVVLIGLIAILVVAVIKLRSGGRETPASVRMSEEAFAAATIKAALSGRPGPRAADAPMPAPVLPLAAGLPVPAGLALAAPAGADTVDAAVLEALPLGLVVTDEAGVVRRCTAPARAWLGLGGAGTGHSYRTTLAAWPAIADALANAHAGDATTAPFVVLTAGEGLPKQRLTVSVARWTPRSGRGGAVVVLSPAAGADPQPALAASADDACAGAIAAAGDAGGTRSDASDEAARLASGLAHALANSLTTVHGYAHLVDRSAMNAADGSALDHITASSEKMLTTVEAFRALVRPLPLTPTAFSPVDAVQAAIALARQEAGRPDADVRLLASLSGTVEGDRVLLEEAIAVVVRNAIEASAQQWPVPAVEVRVEQASGARRVDVVVADRGPGVPDDLRGRIFQPFQTDKPGHEGLGLARAAQVLRAHPGASIALEHPPAGGLVVTIGLPQPG